MSTPATQPAALPTESKLRGLLRKTWVGWPLRVALLAVIGLQLTLDVMGLGLVGGSFQPDRAGTASDWFTGVATLATVVVAAAAIVGERSRFNDKLEKDRMLRQAEADERTATERDLRRHAQSAAFVWVTPAFDAVTGRRAGVLARIANHTGVPIFDWTVAGIGKPTLCGSDQFGPLLPGLNHLDAAVASTGDLTSADLVLSCSVPETGERFTRHLGKVTWL